MKPIVDINMDGNAFSIIGAVSKALKAAGQGDKVEEFRTKAMSGDYDHLLQVAMEYVEFGNPRDNEDEDDDDFGYDPDDEDECEVCGSSDHDSEDCDEDDTDF